MRVGIGVSSTRYVGVMGSRVAMYGGNGNWDCGYESDGVGESASDMRTYSFDLFLVSLLRRFLQHEQFVPILL